MGCRPAFDKKEKEEEKVEEDHTAQEADVSLFPAGVETATHHDDEPGIFGEHSSIGAAVKVAMMVMGVKGEAGHGKC